MNRDDQSLKTDRVKVVHLTYALDMGGCESLQIEFAKWCDKSRFDLEFITVESLGRTARVLEEMGYPVSSLHKPHGFRPQYIPRLASILKRVGADVIHTHDPGPLVYGATAGRLARVPVVVHTRHHGGIPWMEPKKKSLFKFVSLLADTVCCVSHDSLNVGIQEGIPRNRLKTVWNGIDTSRFNYDPARLGQPGPIVSVACLRPDKNTESLIRATASIIKTDPSFQLKIAGDGPPDRVRMLKQMAQDLQVSDHVEFMGNVTNVPELLTRCAALVLPSTTEGISLALLEAMAMGLPTIATRVGGNPEVVEDGVTGILVPANDDQAIGDAMLRLHRDAELRRRMGEAGRVKVVRDFEIRRMVADYESLYLQHLHLRKPWLVTAASRLATLEPSHPNA